MKHCEILVTFQRHCKKQWVDLEKHFKNTSLIGGYCAEHKKTEKNIQCLRSYQAIQLSVRKKKKKQTKTVISQL